MSAQAKETSMAAATVEHAQEKKQEARVVSDAEKAKDIFRYSEWIHVGDGAEECDHQRDGKCQDTGHFHAWVRLANPFQMRDITEKAMAAKARRVRMLRDPESDPRVILEEELEGLRLDGEKSILADEIVDRDFQEVYVTAVKEVDDIDAEDPALDADVPEGESAKLWAGIDQDREEYERQKELPEEQRSEEFEALKRRVADYSRAVEDRVAAINEAKKQPLLERDIDELVDIVRQDRIEQAASAAYLHAFDTWHWYVCTYKPRAKGTPNERYWPSYNAMRFEAPTDVVERLRTTFNDLSGRLGRARAAGNS